MYRDAQKYSDPLRSKSENNLTSLCCTKCNEINVRYSDVQRMFAIKNGINNIDILYTGSCKIFRIHYWLCLEMSGSVLSGVLDV